MLKVRNSPHYWLMCGVFAAGLGLCSVGSTAQDAGYAVGENGPADSAAADPAATANTTAGPVRLARFSYIKGTVTWRPDESSDWAAAPDNLPLKQGAQIWVT